LLRSVVLPVKAVLMNMLSLLGSYGALVFVFQQGHLSGVLNFSSTGFIDEMTPIIMFCTLFGLSMDYEVFLLARIREEYYATGDNARAARPRAGPPRAHHGFPGSAGGGEAGSAGVLEPLSARNWRSSSVSYRRARPAATPWPRGMPVNSVEKPCTRSCARIAAAPRS